MLKCQVAQTLIFAIRNPDDLINGATRAAFQQPRTNFCQSVEKIASGFFGVNGYLECREGELSSRRVRDGFPQEDKRSTTMDWKENVRVWILTPKVGSSTIFYDDIISERKC